MDVATPIRRLPWAGIGACLAFAAGCANWSSAPPGKELGLLPRPQLALDSVVWEVTFVRIPEEQKDFADRFWPQVDEAVLPLALRRRLTNNGFRGGLVGVAVPAPLQEVLDQHPQAEPGGGAKMLEPGGEVVARTHRLRNRSGQTGKIVVRTNPVEKLAALVYHDDGRVSGESLHQGQFLFSLTSFAQGDGQVHLELIPTIEHGQPKFRFRGENGAWMVDNTSRDVRMFDELKVAARLSPGEAIVLTCTSEERGLGEQFFGDDPAEKLPRLLLVVRLQQTQHDNRFDDLETLEPVASIWN